VTASPDAYRAAMRQMASSVSVVTAAYGGRIHGMTATAVTSVSADPPTLLVAVNRTARSHAFVTSSGRFAVHVLNESQLAIASRFAAGIDDQFAGCAYELEPGGCPVLPDAAATFVCRASSAYDVATHTLFIGTVESATNGGRPPLLYFDGAFVALAREPA
jgi:flavin reductase